MPWVLCFENDYDDKETFVTLNLELYKQHYDALFDSIYALNTYSQNVKK